MRSLMRWSSLLLVTALVGVTSCGGDDPADPDPDPDPGSLRATVTGDGDPLAGVEVELFTNGGTSPITSASTAANGQVLFQNLTPGDYDVEVVVPAGFELAAGQTARRDVPVLSDEMATVTFGLEEIISPTQGQVRATVLDDGVPVEDVSVMLYTSGGVTPIQTLQTGATGQALFIALTPGTYDIEVDLPQDYTIAVGDTARKSRVVTAGNTALVEFGIEAPLPTLVEVQAVGTSFSPEDVSISVGGTVRWVQVSNPHTVTPTGHSEWTEAVIDQPGETFEHTFNAAGTFNYRCTIHIGMTGVVRVEN